VYRLGEDLAKNIYRMILKFSQMLDNRCTDMLRQDIKDILIIFQKNEFLVIFLKNYGKFCYYASQKKF